MAVVRRSQKKSNVKESMSNALNGNSTRGPLSIHKRGTRGNVCNKKRHTCGGKPPENQRRRALPPSVPRQVVYLTHLWVVYNARNCSNMSSPFSLYEVAVS